MKGWVGGGDGVLWGEAAAGEHNEQYLTFVRVYFIYSFIYCIFILFTYFFIFASVRQLLPAVSHCRSALLVTCGFAVGWKEHEEERGLGMQRKG